MVSIFGEEALLQSKFLAMTSPEDPLVSFNSIAKLKMRLNYQVCCACKSVRVGRRCFIAVLTGVYGHVNLSSHDT